MSLRSLSIPPPAKLPLAALLTATLGWALFLGYQYYQVRKPLAELPGVPGVGVLAKQPPTFVRGLHGPGDSPLLSPLGVAASAMGDRVYVTDSTGERVTHVFDRGGRHIGKLAPPATAVGGRLPLYVAVGADGTVYVSDRIRATIDRYSSSGEYLGPYEPKESPPAAPMALGFDSAGNLYVTDIPAGRHRLLVYDKEGKLTLSIGQEGDRPGEFSFPNGVAVDSNDRIYVSDGNNGRVQIFDKTGHVVGVIGRGGNGTLGIPRGIGVDSLARLFIVDTTGAVVEVWDVSGEPVRLYSLGSEGVGNGQFRYPNGLALDTTGRVYITDRLNNRVHVWSY